MPVEKKSTAASPPQNEAQKFRIDLKSCPMPDGMEAIPETGFKSWSP
jgi:hypothetical protein